MYFPVCAQVWICFNVFSSIRTSFSADAVPAAFLFLPSDVLQLESALRAPSRCGRPPYASSAASVRCAAARIRTSCSFSLRASALCLFGCFRPMCCSSNPHFVLLLAAGVRPMPFQQKPPSESAAFKASSISPAHIGLLGKIKVPGRIRRFCQGR